MANRIIVHNDHREHEKRPDGGPMIMGGVGRNVKDAEMHASPNVAPLDTQHAIDLARGRDE